MSSMHILGNIQAKCKFMVNCILIHLVNLQKLSCMKAERTGALFFTDNTQEMSKVKQSHTI